MLSAKQQGKIRFIGITNHRLPVAREAVESGLYDTLQFPFSYLSDEKDIALTRLCLEKNVGFIAMKALSGGLLTDIAAARCWLADYENVVPIWGIQRESELDELISLLPLPAELTDARRERIRLDRAELSGNFCRGCGYCLPCPAGISIYMCVRMTALLRRMPSHLYLTEHWRKEMAKIPGCLNCGACAARCPYELDPPVMLQKNYREYQSFLATGRFRRRAQKVFSRRDDSDAARRKSSRDVTIPTPRAKSLLAKRRFRRRAPKVFSRRDASGAARRKTSRDVTLPTPRATALFPPDRRPRAGAIPSREIPRRPGPGSASSCTFPGLPPPPSRPGAEVPRCPQTAAACRA
jgi:ferredoxin